MVFADVRGSTALAERLGPAAFARLLNRFYGVATDVFLRRDAIVDKMIGDEVMAFLLPNTGPDYRQRAVLAAVDLLGAVSAGPGGKPWLPVGIGVHAGTAYAGRVGTADVHDFTVLGDTVNAAARLQAEAKAGEVVISEELYKSVAQAHPGLEQRVVTLRGRAEPMTIRVLRPAQTAAARS